MNFGNELWNAVQLLLLLCMLFWSMTWNAPADMGSLPRLKSNQESALRSKGSIQYRKHVSLVANHYSLWEETFTCLSYKAKETIISSSEDKIIPSFDEWKEEELKKQGRNEKAIPHKHQKPTRRKLNYSSTKCGAKILASNPEAKHRTAILNEKVDEYLLNPCRTRTWFVIEMCDTVEAEQIELANYELYSSSPKQFSVFWSDLFPTQVWHHLGTFVAEDKKTMQTFDLYKRNLGKFIKVIIYSHHGREHYCPLSVFRVLGYSMVHEFEEMEMENKNFPLESHGILPNLHGVNISKTGSEESMPLSNTSISNLQNENYTIYEVSKAYQNMKTNSLLRKHCFNVETYEDRCPNQPLCFFSKDVVDHCEAYSSDGFRDKKRKIEFVPRSSSKEAESRKSATFSTKKNKRNQCSSHRPSKYLMFDLERTCKTDDVRVSVKHRKKKPYLNSPSKKIPASLLTNASLESAAALENAAPHSKDLEKRKEDILEQCTCKYTTDSAMDKKDFFNPNVEESSGFESSDDNAGLLQKESVLVRLTSRIKESEVNLNFINRYLQQLSQSYRRQMEDMQIIFNQTVETINKASEKARILNTNQQKSITGLKIGVTEINAKLNYIMNDHKTVIKQVVELHGFFLILECIIITTIFTIAVNSFHRKSASLMKMKTHSRKVSLWRSEALQLKIK